MTQTTGVNGLTPAVPAVPGAAAREPTAAGGSFGSVLAQMTSDARADGQTVAAGAQGAVDGVPFFVAASNMAVTTLSPTLRVITDGGMQVSPQSLQAFAKSQGLSEDALNSLALLAAQSGSQAAQTGGAALSPEQLVSGDAALRGRGLANFGMGVQSVDPADQVASTFNGLQGSVAAQLGFLKPAATPHAMSGGVGAVIDASLMAAQAPKSVEAGGLVSADMLAQRVQAGLSAVTAGGVQAKLADAADMAKLLAGSVQLQAGGNPRSMVNAAGPDGNASPVLAAAPAVATATLLQMPQALSMLRAKSAAAGGQTWRQDVVLDGVSSGDVAKLLSDGWAKGGDASAHAASHSTQPAPSAAAAPGVTTGQVLGEWHQQQFDALSDKLGQAVAQRIQAQIQRGHWHMSLTLRPQELGSIEVQLGMRGNDLSASFQAAQALTRDLLQDSMPRLREMLAGAGIDVASADVGGQMGQSSGGNSTPTRSPERVEMGSSLSEVAPVSIQPKAQSADDGLDLWA